MSILIFWEMMMSLGIMMHQPMRVICVKLSGTNRQFSYSVFWEKYFIIISHEIFTQHAKC